MYRAWIVAYQIYRISHFIGILFIFFSLGGFSLLPKSRRFWGILHGIGMTTVLVGGLGMSNGFFPLWLQGKILIWLLLGFAPMVIRKQKENVESFISLWLTLGATAVLMGILKPV